MKQLDHLKALAAEYEEKARAIRITIGLLSQNGHAAALDALPGKLRKAIKAEASGHGGARPGAGKPPHKPPHKHGYTKFIRAQRKKTAAVWAAFGKDLRTTKDVATATGYPLTLTMKLAGTLKRYGYLKKVDNGYVHTAKVFSETGQA